jgi:Fungal chitosanase of glycosyl hydrolase group 75
MRMCGCLLTVCLILPTVSHALPCKFESWIEFKGTKLRRTNDALAYYYVTNHSRVDADGAPNSYHPDDIGKNCIHDAHVGLDCPANAGYPNSSWWSSVLTPDPANPDRAYVQRDGEFKGFFVSGTWLSDPAVANTDPRKFVDSTKIPYLVFPGSVFQTLNGTGFRGDVGIAWNLANGKSVSFIVADSGGGEDAKLGEGSISLYEGLGGTSVNPRTGAGVATGDMRFLLFPGSRSGVGQSWPRTATDIDTQARGLLSNLGGESVFTNCP